MSEKETKSYALVLRFGDAVSDLFEQLLKGDWKDSEGHRVVNNQAMWQVALVLQAACDLRETEEKTE